MVPSRASKNTCTACRSAKIRCDRAEPSCDRCTKLGIICIEQVRTQGRPRKPPTPPMPTYNTPCEAIAFASDPATLSSLLQLQASALTDSTAHVNCHHDSSEVNASGSFPELPTAGTSTVASITSTTTVKPFRRPRPADYPVSSLATDLSHGFASFYGRGQACKEKTIAVLRAWGLVSGTHRQDSSHGAFNQIVRALALDHTTAIRAQQRPPATRDVPSGTPLYGPVVLPSSTSTSTSTSTSSSSSGSSSVLHASFNDMDFTDGDKAVAFYIIEGGHVQLSVNPLFHSTHMTFPQALALLSHHKMLPVFLWGSLFTPASQRKFYARLARAIFTSASPVGQIVMDLECVGRNGEAFWGRTTVRHVVEGEGAYASCIISIEPLGVDDARLPPSPAMVALPVVNRKERGMVGGTWTKGRQQGGGGAAAVPRWVVKEEEEEIVREGDDEKEWDDDGTGVDDESSSSSSGSSGGGGGVDALGEWVGPLTRRLQKRKCLWLAGSSRGATSSSSSSSSSSSGGSSPTEIDDREEGNRWKGAYVLGSEKVVLVSLPLLTSEGEVGFQQYQQQMQPWQQQQQPQQPQQPQLAHMTSCGGETSDEEAEEEEKLSWEYPQGHFQDQMWQQQQQRLQQQQVQSVGDLQSTLLSLAALPVQAPLLIGSNAGITHPNMFKQHASVAVKMEEAEEEEEEEEEEDEGNNDNGPGDFDDLMRNGFDWDLITPSPLMRLATAVPTSHIVPPPLLPLT